MSIYPTNRKNWNLLNQLHNDLSNIFEPYLTFSTGLSNGDNSKIATSQWTPPIDIHEEENAFVIHADLPGVPSEDVEITMENGILTIKGQRISKSEVKEGNYSRVERMTGSFYRRFSLPDTADENGVQAESNEGVLTIRIPKKEKSVAKRIQIKQKNAQKEKL